MTAAMTINDRMTRCLLWVLNRFILLLLCNGYCSNYSVKCVMSIDIFIKNTLAINKRYYLKVVIK